MLGKPVLRRVVGNSWIFGIALAAFLVIGVVAWQILTSDGVPDPTAPDLSPLISSSGSKFL